MTSRAWAIDASAPAAMACTATLPMAVASTGPATTRRPQASAVFWQSRRFCVPPPTMWIVSMRPPSELLQPGEHHAALQRQALQRAADHAPLVAGGGWPVLRQKSRMACGMSAGAMKAGSSGLMKAAQRRRRVGQLVQLLPAQVAALRSPDAAALLHQPQAR